MHCKDTESNTLLAVCIITSRKKRTVWLLSSLRVKAQGLRAVRVFFVQKTHLKVAVRENVCFGGETVVGGRKRQLVQRHIVPAFCPSHPNTNIHISFMLFYKHIQKHPRREYKEKTFYDISCTTE